MTDKNPLDNIAEATPVIAQYLTIKQNYQDCLLFFQMGDFYELFFDDAKIAASELDIILTYRGKLDDQDIPMCGVPVHNYAPYTERLVKKGYKIAVCEQTETPAEAKKRGYKAIVDRQVARVLTTGTLTEDHLLDARHDNYLAVVMVQHDDLCVIFYDISTGQLRYYIDKRSMMDAIVKHHKPSEIIYCHAELGADLKNYDIPLAFQEIHNDAQLSDKFAEYFSDADNIVQKAVIILDAYLDRTQCGGSVLVQKPIWETYQDYLQFDDAVKINLEIFKTLSGEKKPTLFHTLDQSCTSAGARLLGRWLSMPLTSIDMINQRQDAIAYFIANPQLAKEAGEHLKQTADIGRIIGRLVAGRASPADLGNIRNSLTTLYHWLSDLQSLDISEMPILIEHNFRNLGLEVDIYHELSQALKDELPVSLKVGDFIAIGYDKQLDEYRDLKGNTRQYILNLEAKYREITGIASLKIKHNNVIGYHIDVSTIHSNKMLNGHFNEVQFVHKQTLANHVRFTTQELMSLEKNIAEASNGFDTRERELFDSLCQKLEQEKDKLLLIAEAIAFLDLVASQAKFAMTMQYCRPEFVTDKMLNIELGRHPVIEGLLSKQHKNFVPNDVQFRVSQNKSKMSPEIWLVTGPNMGGKSTFLRQTALMIIMAQAGLYVPAKQFTSGIFDKIFSRIGASDNLAEGKSTFMTEMSETATILSQATSRSFVILDELGRGTSTYDGLSIAYATLKYLSETIGAMGLFATHYHELTEMTALQKRIGNLQASVTDYKGEIIFLHKIIHGAAQKSYGIHVAQLAGMPTEVIALATEFLRTTEKKGTVSKPDTSNTPLFDESEIIKIDKNPIFDLVQSIDVNRLSPIEAFSLIEKIQKEIN